MAFLLIPMDFIESRSFCLIYNLTGMRCPTCGTTRAFSNAMHLDFGRAISYNPIILVVFPFFWFLLADDVYTLLTISSRHVHYSLFEKIWDLLFPGSIR